MNTRNKEDKGGNVYASIVAERNLRNFALVNSHLLLEKTTEDVQNKTWHRCPGSLRKAISYYLPLCLIKGIILI